MKPAVDRFLEVAAGHVMTGVAPRLGTSYEQANVSTLGVLLLALREEFERAAARRVEENAALRRLFRDSADAVRDTGLRARLEEAAAGEDGDLSVSALELGNAALRAILIELHAHVEELDGPEARRVDEAIWRELALSTERRKLAFALF